MAILVIGGTGHVGSHVVQELAKRKADVRVLIHDAKKISERLSDLSQVFFSGNDSEIAELPANVTTAKGNLMDIDSIREALEGISTVFLLNAVVEDELTKTLLALNLAVEAGVKGIVYFSMVNADTFSDVPHASAKRAAERMIEDFDLPATILRPNYFFQNDVKFKEPILEKGVYPMPIGNLGTSMTDIRDIAEVAALELVKRENAAESLPRELIEISGPDVLTGDSIAAIWSDVTGQKIAYVGDDLKPYEEQMKAQAPSWMAYDTPLMFRGFQRDGMAAKPGAVEHLTEILGHAPRAYRSFAEETFKQWQQK